MFFQTFFSLKLTSPVAMGGFGGLSPPKQSSKTPNWNRKYYNFVKFL